MTLLLHPDGDKLLLVAGKLTADENCCCDIDYPDLCDADDGGCGEGPDTVTVTIPSCIDLTDFGGQTQTLYSESVPGSGVMTCRWSVNLLHPTLPIAVGISLEGFCSRNAHTPDPDDDTIDLSFSLSVGSGGRPELWNLSIPDPSPISWGEMCCNPSGSYSHVDYPGGGCNLTTATVVA